MQTGTQLQAPRRTLSQQARTVLLQSLIIGGLAILTGCGGGGSSNTDNGNNGGNTDNGGNNGGNTDNEGSCKVAISPPPAPSTDNKTYNDNYLPSLGINTETPQAEQDEVVQSVPFADIFRVARPFKELSCASTTYDENGWPTSAPSSTCQIRTVFLKYANASVLPAGQYTVLYDGNATLTYGNYAKLVSHSAGRDVISITFDQTDPERQRFDLNVSANDPANPIKNIRVIMPGGICEGNPFVRVNDASACAAGKFHSFEDTLKANRNAIVFNPDYLSFLKDFRAVRMMNLMEASPSKTACDGLSGDAYTACLVQPFEWTQRASMDAATWGGSARTPLLSRYGRGAPLEVQVELANQLNIHPWFNIPHNASDYYVQEFARYVREHLNPNLKAYVEYTNEAWNNNFWAYQYVTKKGNDAGLGNAYTNKDYWAGILYYAKRSAEVFQIWEDEFGSTSRLVRILGTQQSAPDATRNMLNYSDVKNHVDAVAMGAYFHACWNRSTKADCADTNKVPKTLTEVTSVDDIFAAIDNANDPYGLPSLQKQIAAQASIVRSFGKALYAYEGGQHLTMNWLDNTLNCSRKNSLLDLFRTANRDARMGERYTALLNAWKDNGGQQFMLYTLPQSYHKYGTFGIKESLLQPRSSAPKYDAAMKFQETQGACWWSGC